MKFYIASDHAGFELKSKILEKYKNTKYNSDKQTIIEDIGPFEFVKEDDYPDYVFLMVTKMKKDLENSKGILICMNGGGVCISANKFRGIRAGIAISQEHSKTLISDDNVNIICLGANFLSEDEVYKIVDTFLNLTFTPENRHLRRLKKLSIIENSYL